MICEGRAAGIRREAGRRSLEATIMGGMEEGGEKEGGGGGEGEMELRLRMYKYRRIR